MGILQQAIDERFHPLNAATKQAKLLARGFQASGPQGFGQASRRAATAATAPPVPRDEAENVVAEEGADDEPAG